MNYINKSVAIKKAALATLPNQFPAQREVNAPAIRAHALPESQLPVIVAYKDLDQPVREQLVQHKKNMFIGASFFALLSVVLLMGQKYGAERSVASSDLKKVLPAGVEVTSSEHHHYDKACYVGENGERVCVTRTSKK